MPVTTLIHYRRSGRSALHPQKRRHAQLAAREIQGRFDARCALQTASLVPPAVVARKFVGRQQNDGGERRQLQTSPETITERRVMPSSSAAISSSNRKRGTNPKPRWPAAACTSTCRESTPTFLRYGFGEVSG